MSTADPCRLLVDAVRELSAARAERDSYRLLAQQAIHLGRDQHVEIIRLRSRYHALLDERRATRQAA